MRVSLAHCANSSPATRIIETIQPSLFRDRFVTVKVDGEIEKRVHVRTHDQFCQYLQEKDSSFKREELPFDGRNVAIWWDGM